MKEIQIKNLFEEFDKMQEKYGNKDLKAIYGAGKIKKPNICFVFMNPTGKNISSQKTWKSFRAPWIGTKNIWKMFFSLGLFDEDLLKKIQEKKPEGWDEEFAYKVYEYIFNNNIYITNLSKATKINSTNPTNKEFKDFLDLFKKEISILKPKVIITFGNQVSSAILGQNVKVGDNRKKSYELRLDEELYKIFPVYYPVGQGQRNLEKAKEDVQWILENN